MCSEMMAVSTSFVLSRVRPPQLSSLVLERCKHRGDQQAPAISLLEVDRVFYHWACGRRTGLWGWGENRKFLEHVPK